MKKLVLTFVFLILGCSPLTVLSQRPDTITSSTLSLSQRLSASLERAGRSGKISPADRAAALSTLLKAQRQIWSAARQRTTMENNELRNAAKGTLISALEKDPTLSEAYTMLAELELTSRGQNVAEALAFTDLAIKTNPANFGSRRLRARILTRTSGITEPTFDKAAGLKAIAAWTEVAKLDPQNSEAWAFLSTLYEATDSSEKQLEALRKWVASPAALDSGFYRAVLGRNAELTPDAASLKLADVLIKRNLAEEAVEILTRLLIDDPENERAIDLVAKAVDAEPKSSLGKLAQKLRSALSSNPGNAALALLVERVKSSQM